MGETLTRKQVLKTIATALEEAEEAIRTHPPRTVAIYEQAVSALLEGVKESYDTQWSNLIDLPLEEFRLVNRYMAAMAFMSAWYALHGNKRQRDKAAQSAALLVAGTGLDPEGSFKKIVEYEGLWKQTLQGSGVVFQTGTGAMRYVKAGVLGLVFWFVLTMMMGFFWSILGLPYRPAYSNFLNFILLPVGLFIGWRLTRR